MPITKATQNVIAPITATGSTTARSLPDRFADVVNVKDFGAVGNGVADDTAAIQAAINSVTSGSKIGLFFPRGTYLINGALSFSGRFISFDWEYPCEFIGSGSINGYLLGSTNWQFARRFQNKLFIGKPTDLNDGAMWSNGPQAFSNDWVETEVNATSAIAQLVTISERGYISVLGASRTSDNPLANSEGTMGVAGIVIADKIPTAGNKSTAYGFYVEARRKGNAGFCQGFEVDVISRTGTVAGSEAITTPLLRPNAVANANALIGGWFSNSRPDITDGGDASVAIGIINNAGTRTSTQGRYKVGILFDQNAILGADGTNVASGSNAGNAIALGVGHNIGWWNASATTTPFTTIGSSDTTTLGGGLNFANGGTIFNQSDGTRGFAVFKTAGASNYLSATPSATGTPPTISASTTGSDTVIDIRLSPAGSAGAVTPFVDNTTSLGKSGTRWSAVWSANGTIQTSDEREKTNIADSPLGLDFINSLRPVSYKFKVGRNVVTETDENGLPTKTEPIAGERVHYGLLAQDVKSALPEGIDFGGWILTDKNDPESEQGLRYEEFISPLIKAVKELSEQNATLANVVNDLTERLEALESK
jgi:hypothetical protein